MMKMMKKCLIQIAHQFPIHKNLLRKGLALQMVGFIFVFSRSLFIVWLVSNHCMCAQGWKPVITERNEELLCSH